LLEGLCPKRAAKETRKRQKIRKPKATMEYEQPTSQVLPTEDIVAHECDTWVPIPLPIAERNNQFHEDVVEPLKEVVEPPAKFADARGYEHMDVDEPMSQILMTEEIIRYDYGTWTTGTSVPTLQW
jgi:hypothetical protein